MGPCDKLLFSDLVLTFLFVLRPLFSSLGQGDFSLFVNFRVVWFFSFPLSIVEEVLSVVVDYLRWIDILSVGLSPPFPLPHPPRCSYMGTFSFLYFSVVWGPQGLIVSLTVWGVFLFGLRNLFSKSEEVSYPLTRNYMFPILRSQPELQTLPPSLTLS